MKPFLGALTLLTIIPVPIVSSHTRPSKFAPLFFPLVGLLIGVGAAAAYALFDEFVPRGLSAALVIAVAVIVTGALHIDGLADFADGLFGGRSTEDRLRIMKQPDVGAFGVVAVVLVLLIDWTALSALTTSAAWVALPVVGLISRTAPLIVMGTTDYVSSNGLGQRYRDVPRAALIAVLVLATVLAVLIGGLFAILMAVSGLLTALLVGLFAKRRIGGATGDVYGASIELATTACLVTAVAIIDAGEKLEPIWESF